jgi:hypothetical protein
VDDLTIQIQTRITGDNHKHILIYRPDQIGRLFVHLLRMQHRADLDWSCLDTIAVCLKARAERECSGA